MSRSTRTLLLAVLVALSAVLVAVTATPAAAATAYRPPVDAPVVDGFALPDGPYGAGNRGLEYATVPGSPVRAIGAGLVVFAGPVAGTRAVTVLHPDGLRSSLTHLAEVTVTAGERVAAGQVVGIAGERLHLGIRAGGTYLDPAPLLSTPTVRLVPLDPATVPAAPPGSSPSTPVGEDGADWWSWLVGGAAGRGAGTLARRP